MNRRNFINTSSVTVAGAMVSRLVASEQPQRQIRTNWAGNLKYSTDNLHTPKSLAKVQEVVKKCSQLRGLGSKHSFNAIADSTQNQISLVNLNKVVSLDKAANTITVEGGIKYGEVCKYLHDHGYALHNLASLPHISIAGACATATHGSGLKNGNLATTVSALEFVNAAGDVVVLSKEKDGDQFEGAVVGFGALGIVTKLTLRLQPTFLMKQVVYQNLSMTALETNFSAVEASGYSVSLFTDWKNKNINEVWIKSRTERGQVAAMAPEFFGAQLATKNLHPIETLSPENCTEQMGVPGPWYERLPHFKMGFTPSSGKELQSEYFVPIEHAYQAMMALEKLNEKVSPHLMISEIRTIDADNLWMSPCYKQARAAFHFTWKQDWENVKKVLPLIEEQLAPFDGRPHWGKLSVMSPSKLQPLIQRLPDFKKLVRQYDPNGKFRNDFLNTNIFGQA